MIDFAQHNPIWRIGEQWGLISPRHLPECARMGCSFRFQPVWRGVVGNLDAVVLEHHAPDGQMHGFSMSNDELADTTIDIWGRIEPRIRALHEEPA